MRCLHLSPLFISIVFLPACSGAVPADTAKAQPPATIQHPQTEADLTTVTLSPEAINRLGIETVRAVVERVAPVRTLGGEAVVPEGRTVTVFAPMAGTLAASGGARAGARVARGDTIFRLVPLVSTERDQRIEADRAVATAAADEQAVRQRLQRLEQLLKDGAASTRAVEEARAQLDGAAAALAAARERVTGITRNSIGPEGDIAIKAPFTGIVQTVTVAAGQTVAASAPLFQIAQVDTMWIRVPVYAGEADDLDVTLPAGVKTLGVTAAARPATRVAGPLKGDPGTASVDLYFELSPGGPLLRPGERVLVELPLKAAEDGLVIPDSALLYDMHGIAWVYEDLGDGKYARRRIALSRQVGNRVVVARGLTAGVPVVSVGAAELFGTEFGAGH